MDTKGSIQQKSLELFNAKGLMNVTLRDVAKALDKSYGNITYHYKTKEHLLKELYHTMQQELRVISSGIVESDQVFLRILEAPAQTFDLSAKYLFMFKDFVEIRRNFPGIGRQMALNNESGKKRMKGTLLLLQEQGILRADIGSDDLDYLMELSGAMRTFFFLNLQPEDLRKKNTRVNYIAYINRLLSPYLSEKGKKIYTSFT